MACKGRAQTVRARYLVGGREQVWQAGTQKKAPVQRRGPQAVRRRSREQVNQTPERDRRRCGRNVEEQTKGGSYSNDPLLLGVTIGTTAPGNAQFSPPGGLWSACPKEGWWWREVREAQC